MTTPSATAVRGEPAALSERALAPDFARGMMLLFIVLSNTGLHLYGTGVLSTNALDSVTRFLTPVLIDVRSYPLFSFLFGYGITQLALRQRAAGVGESRVRRLLRRRGWWLFLLGFAHAALLLGSEVLAAYGLISLVLVALFLRRRDRTLLVWAGIGSAVLLGMYLLSAYGLLSVDTAEAARQSTGYEGGDMFGVGGGWAEAVVARLASWVVLLGINAFGVVMPVAIIVGMWAARRRILEEPGRHLRLLATTTAVGLGIGLTGSLPVALSGYTPAELQTNLYGGLLFGMQWTSGLAAGLGYVGLFGLLAHRFTRGERLAVPVSAITALGRRSLSGYLAHSVIMAPLLAAWGLGLGDDLGPASMAAVGIGLWLATVLVAYLLERAGRRGPAEVLLRQLVYGRR